MNSIALISCVSKKRESVCSAQELYISPWFKKARSHVENQKMSWYILSAKYGLLTPDEIISPYEQTLYKMTTAQRGEWALQVYQRFHEIHCNQVLVHIFAGQKYRQHLVPLFRRGGYNVQVPLEGLGIGQQLAWLNAHIHL